MSSPKYFYLQLYEAETKILVIKITWPNPIKY